MVEIVTHYICAHCSGMYDTLKAAEDCENLGVLDLRGHKPQIGEVVATGHWYGWHKRPDSLWTIPHVRAEGSFCAGWRGPDVECASGGRLGYHVLWVVTQIDIRKHVRVYHVYCPETPDLRQKMGFTSDGHTGCVPVSRIPEKNKASRELGRQAWLAEHFDEWHGKTGWGHPA